MVDESEREDLELMTNEEEGFENDFRVCSSDECKNYCLGRKNTCKYCTEIKQLWNEITQLREMNDEMIEHITNLEVNQDIGMNKKRKITTDDENMPIEQDIKNFLIPLFEQAEKRMDKKFKEMETSIKTTILEQEKPTLDSKVVPTYASALSANSISSSNEEQINKSTVMSRKSEDIERRERNLILYGYKESESLTEDQVNLFKFCTSINPNIDPVKIYRLGRKNAEDSATRPIKYIFRSREEAKSMMKDFYTATERHDNLYLKNDYSMEERDEIRKLVDQVKKLNSENNQERWKVRGCPRTKLYKQRYESSGKKSTVIQVPKESVTANPV